MHQKLNAALMALTLTAGVAYAQQPTPVTPTEQATDAPVYSGFLNDYADLKPAADREGILLWVNKTMDYKPYKKIMFDPVEVYLAPNPDYKGLQPDALKAMTDSFLAAFKKALEPEYQVVTTPGPDVLRVRSAITNLQAVKPALKGTDFVPIKAIYNAGRAVAGKSPKVAEMTAEMEVLDAQGLRAAAAVATRKGDQKLKQGEEVTWKELEAITTYWAKSFRDRLDRLRNPVPTP